MFSWLKNYLATFLRSKYRAQRDEQLLGTLVHKERPKTHQQHISMSERSAERRLCAPHTTPSSISTGPIAQQLIYHSRVRVRP